MRITLVHSQYTAAAISGENIAVSEQFRALKDSGCNVTLETRSTDEMSERPSYRLSSAIRVATGIDIGTQDLPVCEGPNHILHVHNLFPNFGRNWISNWDGPVVATLHNYRAWCANGLLLRDSKTCTLCPSDSPLHSVRHACYRDSRTQTVPLAIATFRPEQTNALLRRSDALIVQTERMREFMIHRGTDAGRVHLIPGLVDYPPLPQHQGPPSGWIFLGRLTPEKGLEELLSGWPNSERLDVVGDGPEASRLSGRCGSNVRFVGRLNRLEILKRLSTYEGMLFPGRCWEGAYPMVIREAMVSGVPVVASKESSAGQLVSTHGGGATYSADSSRELRMALAGVRAGGWGLREQARNIAEGLFARRNWIALMLHLYEKVLDAQAT